MKKLCLVLLLLTGCAVPKAGFEVEKIKTNELLGAGYDELDGKIFSIFCGGNGYASYDFVKNSCMQNTASFVKNHRYEYFTMLSKDGNTSKEQSGYIYQGTFIPTTITKHSQSYIILFVDDDKLDKVNNYYKVSDYYVSGIVLDSKND